MTEPPSQRLHLQQHAHFMRAYIIRRLLLMIPTLLLVSILVFLAHPFHTLAMLSTRCFRDQQRLFLEETVETRAEPSYALSRPRCACCTCSTRAGSAASCCAARSGSRCYGSAIYDRGADSPPVAGHPRAWPSGNRHRAHHRAAGGHLLGDPPQHSRRLRGAFTVAVVGLATPNFWLGLLVIVFPAIWWNWTPPIRMIALSDDLLGNLGVFIIPSLILGTYFAAATMRMTRTMMLEVLRQDYVRTAWSKGLRERVVVVRHAIKNALIPVITLTGLQLPILIGGSVIMENIFNLPGIGRLLGECPPRTETIPMVSGVNLVFAAGVVVINLVVDLLYAFLDPRVRYA